MYKFLLPALLILSITSCELKNDEPIFEQAMYFEYNYINFAWGYQNNGWIIDGDGSIRSYNLPEEWKLPDSTGYILEQDLLYNISQTDSIIAVVDSTELEIYRSLIPGAKDGFISKEVHTAADAGSSSLYAYYYDSEEEAYLRVFLGMSGDFSSMNEAQEAKFLVNWLRTYGVFWLQPLPV